MTTSEEKMATAKQKYDEFMAGNQELSAIETAAIMKCGEMCANAKVHGTGSPNIDAVHNGAIDDCIKAILALIPPDGRTQLEQKCMEVANAAFDFGYYDCESPAVDCVEPKLRAIVTNLIGEK